MILPMKKVCLAVQDSFQSSALNRLRELGVVHIERTNATSENLTKANERRVRAEDALGLIQPYKTPKKKKNLDPQGGRERRAQLALGERRGRRATDKLGVEELEPYSLDAVNAPKRPDLVDYMMGLHKERKGYEDQEAIVFREHERIAAWGEFDPKSLSELATLGVPVYLYELTREVFATIPPETMYIKLHEDKVAVRLMVLYNMIPNIAPIQVPEKSLSQLDADLAELKAKIDGLNARFKSFADRRPTLAKEMAAILDVLDFEAARAEFQNIEGLPAGCGISLLKGYVPVEDMDKLKAVATENGWGLISYDPSMEDDVPTKLKNNKFSEMLAPIAGFLGIVPGYREVDVSGWFLFFFTIFFGMIFADAGYGFILFCLAIFGIVKTSKKGVPIPVPLRLLLLLSISNMTWGILTCSWFGTDVKYVPQILKSISFPYFSAANPDQSFVRQNLLLFCFSLGLLHLSVAHILRIFKTIKERDMKVFAEFGSLFMVWGMYNVVLFLMVSNAQRQFPLQPFALYLLLGGFILNFVFSSYETSIGQSITSGLKNIISVILGVTGVFSDIMSYIRLWAVGLAGAAIAETVNTMAGPMLGSFLIFAAIVLLTVGHGLNMVINVLSVLVHGVRLNILEFSSHVKLTWSGTAYRPFTEKR